MSKTNLYIVYVADVPQTGGASSSLFELVQRMQERYGAECAVLLPSDGPLVRKLNDIGVKTVITRHRDFLVPRPAFKYKVAPKYAVEYLRYYANRDSAIRRAEAAIDFSKVDIIHSNLPRNDIGVELSRKHGIPHVCHLRELSFSHFRCWSYRKNPVQYLNDGANVFIAVSRTCGEAWIDRGVNSEKLCVVYNGIDVDALARKCRVIRTSKVREDEVVRLLFLGGCVEAKGIWDAVGAVAELTPLLGKKITLDIYGYNGKGSAYAAVMRYVAAHKLQNNVTVHGETNDVAAAMAGHDIGLVCSDGEAFGRVIVEYWAAGLAVVGADTGAVPELFENGTRGLLYSKHGGAVALASVLYEFVQAKSMMLELRERGVGFAEDYDIEKTVTSVWGVYNSLIYHGPRTVPPCCG